MKRNEVVAAIPARLGSSRFPNKILFPVQGRPLIYHVWNEARKIRGVDRLVIVTDSREVEKTALTFGAEVLRSSAKPKTGTDRIAEVMRELPARFYLNIQGDNVYPFARSAGDALSQFRKGRRDFGTLAFRISDDDDLFNPKVAKLVLDKKQQAVWFSRYPIPYLQKPAAGARSEQASYYGHIGIYLLTASGLKRYGSWKQTGGELAESLEQLRILEHGEPIAVYMTKTKPVSVDTPDDIHKITIKPRSG